MNTSNDLISKEKFRRNSQPRRTTAGFSSNLSSSVKNGVQELLETQMELTLSNLNSKVSRIGWKHQKKIIRSLGCLVEKDSKLKHIVRWLFKTSNTAIFAKIDPLFHLKALRSYLPTRVIIAKIPNEIRKNSLSAQLLAQFNSN